MQDFSETRKIGVIGGGSWGTAISLLLASKGYEVDLWVYEKELAREIEIKRENSVYLPGFKIPELIQPHNSLEKVIFGKKILFSVIPSHVLRETIIKFLHLLEHNVWIISATKGIETGTSKRMTEIYEELLPSDYSYELAVLSGPTFALEVAKRSPTAAVISSYNVGVIKCLQRMIHTDFFRLYTNHDPIGVELGGAVKNVMAIASGISDGIGYGNNTRAAIITRGLAEIMRLGIALGADPLTFSGLAGLGDLVLTCTSNLSRNYSVGFRIGQGESIKNILASMQMVAEGIRNAESVLALGEKYTVELPIIRQVYAILFQDKDPHKAMLSLMAREPKYESVTITRNIQNHEKNQ
ncbi:MAG: glycerol-3-phosphate dehydrogenase [Candidatus Schekmanbacteria bacterium RBG_13_48_7]|uniref:Glycerol-3-phosphate dehydrogenase [NAD(P)+] n=1 Tax=Candidatus Schekmanbacteria bacterium RBG_13_48_7 TaxID=1817878 RepID=A0A1F7RN62_9BACT|nr:MAG: glycerol-3-phosphate dehydrogenase [Candidatus Schekmanbacteria bacterium RBG_13_48_7]